MKSAKNFRRLLLLGAASVALVACSDTDISSPGAPAPAPAPAPTPPPAPTGADVDLVPDNFDASSANLAITEITTDGGQTVEVVAVTGPITEDITFQAGVGYYVDTTVFIGNDAGQDGATGTGVTATFEPGATIYGRGAAGGVYVNRGSQINAAGTEANPVVFTSFNELLREQGLLAADAGARAEWLGLVINGFAPINNCNTDAATPGSADCEDDGEAGSGVYGGGDAADNSGTLNYVRVEHAGVFFNEEDQSNGIAFQGVGSGTQVSNIQVHNNGDDGVEFFGGTVSATNVVLTGAADDSVDWTDGWTGSLQRVLVIQSADDADYAIEADNRSVTAPDTQPRSFPKISNFTFVGGDGTTDGVRLREGTAALLANGIFVNFDEALKFGDEATAALLVNGPSAVDGAETTIASHIIDETAAIPAAGNITGDQILAATQDVLTPSTLANADFVPGPEVGAVPVFDVNGIGELTNLGFIGAFSPSETEADNWAAGWTKPGSVFADDGVVEVSCPESGAPGDYTITQDGQLAGKLVCAISGTVTRDLTLGSANDIIYRLDGTVFVGEDDGPTAAGNGADTATLTIEPGVTVYGDASVDGLYVARGSRIEAVGTAAEPIVFTSGPAIRGQNDYASDTSQWLGMVLNGKAPINRCNDGGATPGTSDCEFDGEAGSGLFGGGDANDDSGALEYVRVEFAGIFFNEEDQSNGIAFQGVGDATDINFIQVHNNGDDGIEFFGGTANAKNVVMTGARDDSIDWTDGWKGKIQYALLEHHPDSDYGFEGDNRSVTAPDTTPRSTPQIANFTILGAKDAQSAPVTPGARFREGMGGDFFNGLIVSTSKGLDIDDASNNLLLDGPRAPDNAELTISGLLLDTAENIDDDDANVAEVRAAITNLTETTSNLSGFSFYTRADGLGVVPGLAEANADASDTSSLGDFFDATTYLGAVENADDTWYLGWTVDASGNVTSAN